LEDKLFRKGLVLGIIVLFIGACVLPSTTSENNNFMLKNIESTRDQVDLFLESDERKLHHTDAWEYFRVIYLSNPVNNCQIPIKVNKSSGGDVNCNNHCRDDFGDIRFLDIDNITHLNYWIEEQVNGSYACFWVKLPDDVESDKKILIWYGNENATTTSNGTETFIFFDDFNTLNTSIWDEYDPNNKATVTAENGLLHIAFGSVSGGSSAGIETKDKVATDALIVTKTKGEKGSNEFNQPFHLMVISEKNYNYAIINCYRQGGPPNYKYNRNFFIDKNDFEKYCSDNYPGLSWRILYIKKLQDWQAAGVFTDYYNGSRLGFESTGNLAINDSFYIQITARTFDSGLDSYWDWIFVANYSSPVTKITKVGPERLIQQPPYPPSNPDPKDNETGICIYSQLSWDCEDPNGDPLTFDVYFGTSSPPPIIAKNHSGTTYDLPENLNYSTKYYWKIVAWDDEGLSTAGSIWTFTTRSNETRFLLKITLGRKRVILLFERELKT